MHQVKKRMGSGPEARIRAMYKAHRHSHFYYDRGMSELWRWLAYRWKRPIREIKKICNPARYGALDA